MKQTFNLADKFAISPKQFNRYLLAFSGLLLLLVAVQARQAIHVRQANGQLQQTLDGQRAERGEAAAKPAIISKTQLKRQAEQIVFANGIIAKDAFKWSVLLERLEQTLTDGIALERVHPDPKTGNIDLVGRARDLSGLQGYLHGLSRSTWFADAYLLEQERTGDKKPGKQPYLKFKISVKEAF